MFSFREEDSYGEIPRKGFFGWGQGNRAPKEEDDSGLFPACTNAIWGDDETKSIKRRTTWFARNKDIDADESREGVNTDFETTEDGRDEEIPAVTSNRSIRSLTSLMQDKRQVKVLYEQFANDPFDVLKIVQADGIPTVDSANHVVVRVQVSVVSRHCCHSMFVY
jgi:hypothetical protein